jgi:predicted permease
VRRAVGSGLGRGHIGREVDAELAFHLEMRTAKLIASGMPPEAARLEALRQFGDVAGVRDSCITFDQDRVRAMKRTNLFDELRQDLAYAARMLRRNLAVTAVVTATLALGIGANTAIFTLVNAVLLRPLPVPEPERLLALGDPSRPTSVSFNSNPEAGLFNYETYTALRDRNRLATGVLASGRADRVDVRLEPTATEVERPRGRFVSGNYFGVLGVPAFRGRTLNESDDQTIGGSPVIAISHGYWTRRFDQDPGVVGREILINGLRFTIVGVTPPWFQGEIVGRSNDVYIPLTMQPVMMPNQALVTERNAYWLLLLARLGPGVTEQQGTTGFTTLIKQIALERFSQDPRLNDRARELEVFVGSGARGFSRVRSTFQMPLLTLGIGVGLLLLIICANVANLLLARAVARGREMSVRLAIGADRFRLVRQLLTESLVLGLLGAAAGLAVAWWGSRALLALAGEGAGVMAIDARIDLVVLAFTGAVSIVAVVLFGLVPALRASRIDLVSTMRAHATSVTGSGLGIRGQRMPLGKMLISAQVALSLVLLIGAALLSRSLRQVQRVETGLDRDHLLIVDVDAASRGYSGARMATLLTALTERIQRIPGVTAVSYSENGIFSGTESASTLQVPGFVARSAKDTSSRYDQIGPGYVAAIGARLLQGRDILPSDDEGAPFVAIINETMSRFYFGSTNGVGRTFTFDDTTVVRIVGVIADVRDHDLTQPHVRRFYVPYLQRIPALGEGASLRLEVRAAGNPGSLVMPVRRAIMTVDPAVPIDAIDPLPRLMEQSIRGERLLANLATGFGALALLLAAVGLYGVMTYAITRRTSEIGLRVALGAQRGAVIGLVMADAIRLVLLGVIVGVPMAIGAARFMQSQLHGVESTDLVSIAIALAVLGASAGIAAMLPALRASRVAPIVALRQE